MNRTNTYFSSQYLLSVATGSKFEFLYLSVSIFMIVLVVLAKLAIVFKKKRIKAYKSFDNIWFWGYFTQGLAGLFIWFSRTESLAFFSSRLVSYFWIILNFVLAGYLIYYYKNILPQKIEKHFEKSRKEKYLH